MVALLVQRKVVRWGASLDKRMAVATVVVMVELWAEKMVAVMVAWLVAMKAASMVAWRAALTVERKVELSVL